MICTINYSYYGIFALNDRTGTEFEKLMATIIKIDYEDSEEVDKSTCIVSYDKMEYIVQNSESLLEIKDNIMSAYSGWAGDGNKDAIGDYFAWAFRSGMSSAGYYESATKANEFCKKVRLELEEKIENGELRQANGIFLSSSTKMLKLEDLPGLIKDSSNSAYKIISYETAITKYKESKGDTARIREVEQLTNSILVYPEQAVEVYNKVNIKCVNFCNIIIKIYSVISVVLTVLALPTYIVITVLQIKNLKQKNTEFLNVWLILTGMLVSFVLVVVMVTFFMSFLENWINSILFYASGAVVVLQIFQVLALYTTVMYIVNKIKAKKNGKNIEKTKLLQYNMDV